MRLALVLTAAWMMTACATTTRVRPTCLPMATITAEEQEKLAAANDALDGLPEAVRVPLRTTVRNYLALRAANRAACGR
jgi:hypothetical protein